ncbi:DNA polymerase III subunit delta [Alteriqipengyuania lutimaris]|uniref:DNA-directed DNA polymerase n=1 Tax=Alteriqipengyuania lutimaris TaxID=1538146 RepID=A0A395LIU9_9SPHN|nr:DNA polymerase III subunit delta [Alteriqipengyuania lutimaris]MBB3034195.1 DNA polymerase-3 subunit delta [Alteriqipengyuania lutimaris]RDS76883.1 DNA polymerase III subunit delta [Alteriqipengyuania lutimaris]
MAKSPSLKANQNSFGRMAGQAARECHTFFFCGPDESAASAAAARIVSGLENPGERIDMAGADLRRDPVLLADEARSSSLFGDARHILVRANGEEAHDALKLHFEAEGEACPVLVVATSATDKSRTAKLVAGAGGTLVAMFYPPNLRDMAETVRDLADRSGLRLGGDLAQRIARGSGLDRRLAEAEVEKLALFLDAAPDSPKTADLAAWDAIGASSEEDGFMPLVNAALGGHAKRLPEELARLQTLSLNPVGVALAFERRAAQLAQLSARMRPGEDVASFVESQKRARRIFFKDERDLAEQLRIWRGKRLDRLVSRLTALHQALLANSQQAELLLSQEIASIARAASR